MAERNEPTKIFNFIFFVTGSLMFLYNFIRRKAPNENTIGKAFALWVSMNVIYVLYMFIFKGVFPGFFSIIVAVFMWAIVGYTCIKWGYYSNQQNIRNENFQFIVKIALITLLFVCLRSLYLRALYPEKGMPIEIAQELINRNPYLILWLSALLLVTKYRFRVLIFAISFLVILSTAKRGPLVAAAFAGFLTLLLNSKFSVIKRIAAIWIVIVGVIGAYFVMPDFFNTLFARFDTSDSDVSSYRFEFWTYLFGLQSEADLSLNFFGFGFYEAQNYIEKLIGVFVHAHSDWVEIFFDYGLLGIIIFISMHIAMIKVAIISKKKKYEHAWIFMYFYFMFLLSNFYTGTTMTVGTVWFSIPYGYLYGDFIWKKNKLLTPR
ncbi:O-antigen ligase family protein [Dysgonomonas sp. ZJ279]|uniref:O-antigen ligase family protein n=1 Tax=Dysgonomonas sp. ZJ279 TaxID=2709796 RepID=UPI001C88D91B|nr:O-antigen ligase family protein [Dysgonomonas sp. ZJ279]